MKFFAGTAGQCRFAVQFRALNDGQLQPRSLVVTFDDGYLDNLSHAKPLLERHEISATMFLASGYVEATSEFWWDELERILLETDTLPPALSLVVKGHVLQWDVREASSPLHLYYAVYEVLKALSDGERRKVLDELRTWAMVAQGVRDSRRCLSLEDVLALNRGGLIEIGSHTVTHPLLPVLSVDSQRAEIQKGKSQLEDILDGPVMSFAYPYGQYTAQTLNFVREAGFSCGCAVDANVVDGDRFRLPRVKVEDWDGDQFAKWLSAWFER